MLPQVNRLRKSQDFAVVYRRGRRLGSSALALRAYRTPEGLPVSAVRIGFSISQKVSKRAVIRNQIKRRLRAACRQLLPELHPGWDLVVVVRSPAVECDYWQFLQQLRKLFVEAEILDGH